MIQCIKRFLEVITHPYCVLFLIYRSRYFTVSRPTVPNLFLLLQNSCTSFSVFPCYSSSVSDFLPTNWGFAPQASSLIKALSCHTSSVKPNRPVCCLLVISYIDYLSTSRDKKKAVRLMLRVIQWCWFSSTFHEKGPKLQRQQNN